jgi:endonuclease YncB( thermonuclease family)
LRWLVSLVLIGLSVPACAQVVTGSARALDGDILDMTGQRVRLAGIDAPELGQKCIRDGEELDCGEQARRQLAQLVANSETACTMQEASIASCEANGRDLAEAMVGSGLAIAIETSPGYAPYAEVERPVRNAKVGIWASTFDPPSQWRKAHPGASVRLAESARGRASTAPRAATASTRKVYRSVLGCAIKGNVSYRDGEQIYYLPGMKYYDGTRPERLFCTEEEAQAAGYRRSRGG